VTAQKITKRVVDALKSGGSEFTLWDNTLTGFGVRVRATGAKSYVVVYRAGQAQGAARRSAATPLRRLERSHQNAPEPAQRSS
jgi:hypothetical protein